MLGPSDDGSAPPFPIDPERQRWGLGDVGAGIFASMSLSLFVGSLIVSLAGWTGDAVIPIWGLALLQIPLWGGYLGVTAYVTSTKGTGVVPDLGVASTLLDAPIGLAVGVATQLLVLPVIYIPIFELTSTSSDELSEPARELAGRAGSAPGWVLFGLIVGVGAPVVEELFYRGLFLRSLQKRGAPGWAAVLVVAAVFAAIHFQALQFPGLFAFGAIAGALTVRTGRLGPAIWAHIGFNLTTVVALYDQLNRG